MDDLQSHLLVALGGAIGGRSRRWIGGAVARWYGTVFPWGTIFTNVTGCFRIGLFMTAAADRLALDPRWRLLAAVGFCGGCTTFSTFAYETSKLTDARATSLRPRERRALRPRGARPRLVRHGAGAVALVTRGGDRCAC